MSSNWKRQIREWERPEPTAVWQTLGILFGGFAFALGVAALTVSGGTAVRPPDLWIAAAGFLLAALLCFAAHYDVNRGRRTRWIELEELPPADKR